MSDIPTAVMAIKTTGEIVYVLSIKEDEGSVEVRRPVLSESGISHTIETFFEDELESVEAYVNREATMQTYKIKAQKNILEKAIRELEEAEREEANKKQRKAPLSIVN
jgi:hypothetical protein